MHEVAKQITAKEFVDWVAYFQVKDNALKKEHVYLAQLAFILKSVFRGKDDPAPLWEDCFFDYDEIEQKAAFLEKKKEHEEEMKIRAWVARAKNARKRLMDERAK